MNADIIIIGGNHHNTLGVIRSLGWRGIKPDVILVTPQNKPFVGKSKYINKLFILSGRDEALDILLEHKHTSRIPIIACSDQDAVFLDSNKNKLGEKYYLPATSSGERMEYWMDKDNMARLAESVGLSVPKSYNPADIETDSIEYPVIVKPKRSIDGCKKDICILKNKEAAKSFFDDKTTDYQIQSYINKKFEYQLIGCSIDSGREIHIPGYSRIIRQPDNTNTGFLSYHCINDSFPIKECLEFIRSTSYSGLFSMEFLRGENGKDYFMEINFRNDGNAICVTAAGVNLPYIWYAANMGLPYDRELQSHVLEILVMPEFDDFLTQVVHKKISLRNWIHDVRRTDCFMEYDRDDKSPFYARLNFEAKRLIRKIFNF